MISKLLNDSVLLPSVRRRPCGKWLASVATALLYDGVYVPLFKARGAHLRLCDYPYPTGSNFSRGLSELGQHI